MERDLARKRSDPDQFDEPPVPLWVKGRPGDGMPPREVTQDELRHLRRLYPERGELSGGGLKFVELLFFNAAERLPERPPSTKGAETKCKKWLQARVEEWSRENGPVPKRDDLLAQAQDKFPGLSKRSFIYRAWPQIVPDKWKISGPKS